MTALLAAALKKRFLLVDNGKPDKGIKSMPERRKTIKTETIRLKILNIILGLNANNHLKCKLCATYESELHAYTPQY